MVKNKKIILQKDTNNKEEISNNENKKALSLTRRELQNPEDDEYQLNSEENVVFRWRFIGGFTFEYGIFCYKTVYFSIDIPVDYQTEEEAKNSFFSLRFEFDKDEEEFNLIIYSDSGNVLATIHWDDREKYNYYQSYDIEDVLDDVINGKCGDRLCHETWTKLFEHCHSLNVMVDELLCKLYRYPHLQKEESTDYSEKIDLFAQEIKDSFETENEEDNDELLCKIDNLFVHKELDLN